MPNSNGSVSESANPFAVKDCALMTIALGKRAQTLKELRETLSIINPDSIYFHFWGNLLRPRFEEREYNNDFAAWARHGLHDDKLAEQLSVIDPTYADLANLRQEILDIIDQRLDESEYLRWSQATEPFEFTRSQIVVFDTHRRVDHPEAMTEVLPSFSPSSIFYHFIDARRRLDEGLDDFRFWLQSFPDRYHDLSEQLADIDPYFASLTELRQELTTAFQHCCQGAKDDVPHDIKVPLQIR